jgi:hypothetical protein
VIDPLETVLVHLKADAALATAVGNRITAKAKYGMEQNGWADGVAALTLELLPASADLYTGTIPFRLTARCYGKDQQDAMAVWQELHRVIEATERTVVTVTSGDALLYYLVQESMPEVAYDPDIKMDSVFVDLRGAVHRDSVT